jgi:hypothetical protein
MRKPCYFHVSSQHAVAHLRFCTNLNRDLRTYSVGDSVTEYAMPNLVDRKLSPSARNQRSWQRTNLTRAAANQLIPRPSPARRRTNLPYQNARAQAGRHTLAATTPCLTRSRLRRRFRQKAGGWSPIRPSDHANRNRR